MSAEKICHSHCCVRWGHDDAFLGWASRRCRAGGRWRQGRIRSIAVLGPLGDPIFSTIEKGAVDAAKAAGVDFEYTAPQWLRQPIPGPRPADRGWRLAQPRAMVIGNFIPDAENGPIRAVRRGWHPRDHFRRWDP